MNPPDSQFDQELTDLLVAYDAELAGGGPRSRYVNAQLRCAPPELRQRFDRARACLLLIERVWPRSGPLPRVRDGAS
jgi:hypothetical protein